MPSRRPRRPRRPRASGAAGRRGAWRHAPRRAFTAVSAAPTVRLDERWRSAPCGSPATSTSEAAPSRTPIPTARRRPAARRWSRPDSAGECVLRGGTSPVRERQLAQARGCAAGARAPGCGGRSGRRHGLSRSARAPGRAALRSPVQSGAPITPSRSTSSTFQGCTIVAATMPASRARAMFTGLSSTSTWIPSSSQRVTLSNEQCRSS